MRLLISAFRSDKVENFYLEEVRRIPFIPPKQDAATNTGTIHAIDPYS